MPTQHVLEYSRPSVRGNVIRGVKVIGLRSEHGWSYPPSVLGAAIELYENAPVFITHGNPREKRQGSRLLRDHLGNLEDVRGNGDGLFADLKVKPSHPLAKDILEQAPTASFGLSHNAIVEISEDETEVTQIVEVNSVDLVDDPATTKNLFEDNTVPDDKPNDAAPEGGDATTDGSFEDKMLAFMAKILAYIEPKDADLVKDAEAAGNAVAEGRDQKPVKRLTALEDRGGDDGDAKPTGNTHEDFMGAVRGFALTN